MKIFVTGATGYIGNKIALAAATVSEQVTALVRDPQSILAPAHDNIRLVKGDLTDEASVMSAMKGSDHVIHAGGLTRLYANDSRLFYQINVDGTRNVLRAATACGVKKLVYTSSCAVLGPSYKHPISESDPRLTAFENDYEISKAQAESLLLEYGTKDIELVTVAPSRVFGHGLKTPGNPISDYIDKTIRCGYAFIPSAGHVVGNYAFVDDVVNGHLLALAKGKAGNKYILGGENLSYDQFFNCITEISKTPIMIFRVPKWLLTAWSISSRMKAFFLNRSTHMHPKLISRLLQNRAVSSDKAVSDLGYTITPFREGLRRTIEEIERSRHEI